MKNSILVLVAAVLQIGTISPIVNADIIQTFTIASVHFEQNATDGDVEVVFKIKGDDEGMSKLKVTSPDGRTVIDFNAPNSSTLGIRQFNFESPEPKDLDSLKMAYPEGVYTFTGTTTSSKRLQGKAILSHKLPATASFILPKADAKDVQFMDLFIKWTSVDNVSAYIIEIDQDEMNTNLVIKQGRTSTSFKIPDGFLFPGTEYSLSIGTITNNGNTSFVDTKFRTAKKTIPNQ